MSGAQGAMPKGAPTDTTYESKPGSTIKERLDSKEDSKGVQVELAADHAKDAPAGHGGPVFGDPDKEAKGEDLGLSGTA